MLTNYSWICIYKIRSVFIPIAERSCITIIFSLPKWANIGLGYNIETKYTTGRNALFYEGQRSRWKCRQLCRNRATGNTIQSLPYQTQILFNFPTISKIDKIERTINQRKKLENMYYEKKLNNSRKLKRFLDLSDYFLVFYKITTLTIFGTSCPYKPL